jgi:hypothetical protein
MNRLEGIKERVSVKILPVFADICALESLSSAESFITADSSLKMSFGMFSKIYETNIKSIFGRYGIRKIDPRTGEEVAVCGFDVQENEMIISHTPQGKRPEEFSSQQVRHRFGRSDFRIEMMEAMIEIARQLNLKGIIGYPITHQSFDDKELKIYLKKIRARDLMFELFGFSLTDKDPLAVPHYYLPLNPTDRSI